MEYIKINEYPLERLVFGDNDYYDVDYYDGVGYQSAKILGSVIKAGILSAVETIYNSDGTLNSNRIIQGDLKTLLINNLRKFTVNVNPSEGTTAIDFTVVPNGDLLRIRDTTANKNRLRITQNGEVEINEEYKLPLLDGTAGQVLATDGAGNLSFITLPPAPSDVNIYNSDGVITGTRVVDANNNFLTFDNVYNLRFNTTGVPFGVSGFEINAQPLGTLFTVRNATTNIPLIKVSNTKVFICNEYALPDVDGTAGQVMATDGAGLISFIDLPTFTSDNIYNIDGTLTANRTLTGNNFTLLLQTLGKFSVHSHLNNAENIEFRVRNNTGFYSFVIRDHNTNASLLAVKEGKTEINGVYRLPNTDGVAGAVMTTDGAGNLSFNKPFIPASENYNVERGYTWINNSNTVQFRGVLAGQSSGTATILALTGATVTKIIRSRFISGTTSGSIAGYRGVNTDFFIGQGFHFIATFGYGDATFNSSAHNWIGLGASASFQIGSLTYAEDLGNIIGIGSAPTDTTLQILHNNSTGTAVKIPLGADFPSNRLLGSSFGGIICFEMYNEYGSSDVKYRVTRVDTGTVETGIITSTDKPSNTTALCPVASRSNGTSTSINCALDLAQLSVYTKF